MKRSDRLAKIIGDVENALAELEELKDEVQGGFDAMPENLQGSDLGAHRESTASTLDECHSSIECALSELSELEFR